MLKNSQNTARMACLAVCTAVLLCGCGKKAAEPAQAPGDSAGEPVAETRYADTIDADSYFEERGEVLRTIDAKESKKVKTERSATELLTDYGFGELPIEAEYDMNGTYSDAAEISGESGEKHPMYTTFYQTENGDWWCIYVIDGAVFADPVSYNLQSGSGCRVLLSETTHVISYDNVSNQFYETVPDTDELRLITVMKVDAGTLEQMTREELSK